MVWPDWLSVDSRGTVSYNTNGITLGYWNYAVRIEDPYSYVHIDFLIIIKETQKFCGCPEAARQTCTGVADCSACSNATKSCDVNTPPTFSGATPAAGGLVKGCEYSCRPPNLLCLLLVNLLLPAHQRGFGNVVPSHHGLE